MNTLKAVALICCLALGFVSAGAAKAQQGGGSRQLIPLPAHR